MWCLSRWEGGPQIWDQAGRVEAGAWKDPPEAERRSWKFIASTTQERGSGAEDRLWGQGEAVSEGGAEGAGLRIEFSLFC